MIFSPFKNELLFAITSRSGGVSKTPYDSLNLALHVNDNPLKVLENRVIVSKKYGFDIQNLIYMEQTHSDNVAIIRDSSMNKIEDCDALITNVKNIPLMVMVADCLPILFFNKTQKVIAVAHAGRNGTIKEISKKTILRMIEEFDLKASDILIYIGASIGKCCYEVGYEIVQSVSKEYIEKRDKKYYLDLQSMNIQQLLSVGIKKDHIEISQICTCCDKEYFSYRRDGVTGRFSGILKLK